MRKIIGNLVVGHFSLFAIDIDSVRGHDRTRLVCKKRAAACRVYLHNHDIMRPAYALQPAAGLNSRHSG